MAGYGEFGAVGFSYNGGPGVSGARLEESSASESSDSEDEEAVGAAGSEAVDNLAALLGLEDFSLMLRRTEREEANTAAGNIKRPKWATSALCFAASGLVLLISGT